MARREAIGSPSGGDPSVDVVRRSPELATAAELRRLLLNVAEYRQRWSQQVRRRRDTELSHTAVARVLRGVEAGETSTSLDALRDRVRRAVRGEVLAPPTLRLFIEGFAFTAAEQERLWALLSHRPRSRRTDRVGQAAAGYGGEAQVRTLSRAIDIRVGPDRTSWVIRSTLTVQALVDDVAEFPLRFANDGVVPTARSGCRIEPGPAPGADGLRMLYIRFPRPLHAGEVHVYAYDLAYTARTGEVDRYVAGVVTPTAVMSVQVGFTPPQLPSRVLWRTWSSLDLAEEDVVFEREVQLTGSHRASWTQQEVDSGLGGFEWHWDAPLAVG
ncbi:hypothetical protein [Georgenia sunbinii]|uniref:hypothetical protein n=1 Tax=Georgenia sunbinii TaxID=3117728 RepID=UPI002F26C3E4